MTSDASAARSPRRRRPRPLKALDIVQWVRHVPRNAQLFVQGETAEGAFLISRGRVSLLIPSSGQTREIAVAGAGDLVGLSAAIGGKPHQCSALAVTACTVGFIRRDDLLRLMRDQSEVCFYLLQCLAADISVAQAVLRRLAVSAHARHAHHSITAP